ncbi:MAG: pyridoxine 5'-phosphate synthase, partial [Gammaproteobacteria bacterium]
YADAPDEHEQAQELHRLSTAAQQAARLGIEVHAGHGLNYHNIMPVAAIAEIVELNIGHSIMARALMIGLPEAVRDMQSLMRQARGA